jgi:hypothetical protein
MKLQATSNILDNFYIFYNLHTIFYTIYLQFPNDLHDIHYVLYITSFRYILAAIPTVCGNCA